MTKGVVTTLIQSGSLCVGDMVTFEWEWRPGLNVAIFLGERPNDLEIDLPWFYFASEPDRGVGHIGWTSAAIATVISRAT